MGHLGDDAWAARLTPMGDMAEKLFSKGELEAIAAASDDTSEGLTGSEIGHLLASIKMIDPTPTSTKWLRLHNAFVERQNRAKNRRAILIHAPSHAAGESCKAARTVRADARQSQPRPGFLRTRRRCRWRVGLRRSREDASRCCPAITSFCNRSSANGDFGRPARRTGDIPSGTSLSYVGRFRPHHSSRSFRSDRSSPRTTASRTAHE